MSLGDEDRDDPDDIEEGLEDEFDTEDTEEDEDDDAYPFFFFCSFLPFDFGLTGLLFPVKSRCPAGPVLRELTRVPNN